MLRKTKFNQLPLCSYHFFGNLGFRREATVRIFFHTIRLPKEFIYAFFKTDDVRLREGYDRLTPLER